MGSDTQWQAAVRKLQWHLYCRDVEPWRVSLSAYCRGLTADRDVAEDLLQETLLRGFRVVGQLCKGIDRPKAFLFRVAKNLWIDWLRKPTCSSLDEYVASVESRSNAPLGPQLEEGLRFLANTLSPTELRVFVLRDLYEYTGPEVAGMLGTSNGAVKMAASRARRRIRRAM